MAKYYILPVSNGEPDLDWSQPPIEAIQPNDTERYCMFPAGVTTRASWTEITEAEYTAMKPTVEVQESMSQPTNAEINEKLELVLQGLALLSVQ